MDRVQRSGLITLAVLLLTAVGAHFVGSRPGSDATVPEAKAAQDPSAWEGVVFLPPEQRQKFVGAGDFVRPPIRNPLTGVGTRNINLGADEPPDDDGTGSLAANRSGESGRLLNIDGGDPEPEVTPQPTTPLRGSLPTGPGTGRDPQRTTRVRERENLTKLAQRHLGDGERWKEIADLNGLQKPYTVQVGQLLFLPPKEPSSGAVANAGGTQRNEPRAEAASARRTYKVQPGDTLGEISQKVYQSSKHWMKIRDANGMSSDRELKAGQVLTIPPLDD